MRALSAILATCCLAAGEAVPKFAPADQPSTPPMIRPLNRGVAVESHLADRGSGDKGKPGAQSVGLWVPDGITAFRGVIHVAHRSSPIYRTDLQEFCRAHRFALFATLTRWIDFEDVLPYELERLAKAAKAPQLIHAPWLISCYSRNVGASMAFAQNERGQRTLLLFAGGGPGEWLAKQAKDNTPERIAFWKERPILILNGSSDPFVNKLSWLKHNYVKQLKLGAPFCAAPEWGGGHNWKSPYAMWSVFAEAVWQARVGGDWSTDKGPVQLKPWPAKTGFTATYGAWDTDTWGPALPIAQHGGDWTDTAWLPDARSAAVWRAQVSRDTTATIAAQSDANGVTLTLNEPPAEAKQVTWYDADQALGKTTAPFAFQAADLRRGVHSIYAVIEGGAKPLWTQPVLIADGALIDPRSGDALEKEYDGARRMAHLDATLEAVVEALEGAKTGGAKPSAEQLQALKIDLAAKAADAKFSQRASAAKKLLASYAADLGP